MSLIIIAIITVLVVMASIHGGHWLYGYMKKSSSSALIEPSASAIGAMMGLLAFMLAFAFSMGVNRLNVRIQLLLDEMNAIGTLHLRADFLPDNESRVMKSLLVEYAKLRVDVSKDPKSLRLALARSSEINDELWSLVTAYDNSQPNHISTLSLIEATNRVIDIYGSRVFAGQQHIPVIIWAVLVAMTILAMIAIGYQMGVSGKMSNLLSIIMALTFSAVLILIADLDRFDQGFFMLPQQPMINFYESIKR